MTALAPGRLANQTIIVSGAAQGLGADYARALAGEGARVGLCDILSPQAVVDEITSGGGKAIGAQFDVTDSAAVVAFVQRAEAELGPIDGLVNNAAIFGSLTPKPIHEIDSAEFHRVLTVNTLGVFEFTKAVVPGMKQRRQGRIVNVASATVMAGIPYLPHYVASKGAVIALTRSLARELGNDGILVNALAPGLTTSQAVKQSATYSAMQAPIIERRCIKREQLPQDLIGAVLFLLSADSAFMTGQTLVIDGGAVMT